MNDSSDTNKAWAWYDPGDGSIKQVTFVKDHVHPAGTEEIEMDPETAKAILLGTSRLYEYKVVVDTSGVASVKYQPITVTEYFSKFWTLEEEIPVAEIPFMGLFEDATAFKSPLRIRVTDSGFDITVVSINTRAKVYITRKNDPNYLVRTVDIAAAIKEFELGPIPVDLEDADEYSIYVRYYNAA